MSEDSILPWGALERWRGRLCVLGAVILIGSAAILVYDVLQGTDFRLPYGQVFVGAGWTAVSLGLLGLYRDLAARHRWLARASGVLVAIGVLGYGLMTVVFVAASAGLLVESTVESLTPVFLPPVLVGTLLAFPVTAAATLYTGAHDRVVGVLLFAPPIIFVTNVATGSNPESILGVVVALIVVFGSIGHLLRAGPPETAPGQPAREAVGD